MFYFGAFLLFAPIIAPLLSQSHPFLAMGLILAGVVCLLLAFVYATIYLFWREILAVVIMIAVCVIPF
jgi:hypothetical protein